MPAGGVSAASELAASGNKATMETAQFSEGLKQLGGSISALQKSIQSFYSSWNPASAAKDAQNGAESMKITLAGSNKAIENFNKAIDEAAGIIRAAARGQGAPKRANATPTANAGSSQQGKLPSTPAGTVNTGHH
jgi:hypothetical protein